MPRPIDTILHGDCLEQLQRLEPETVDLAFADPPFNIGYDYDAYDDEREDADYLGWSKRWIEGVVRALKPDGTFWLAIGDEYAAELKVCATRELGLHCRSWVIWYYTFGVHCRQKFARSHAHLFHFVRDPRRFTFNDDAVRVPSARQLVYGDKRADPRGRVPDDTWLIPPLAEPSPETTDKPAPPPAEPAPNSPGRSPTNSRRTDPAPKRLTHQGYFLRPQDLAGPFTADGDTWYFPRVCGTFKERQGFHGCQMPEQLLGRIIRVSSREGDLVLDPFAGSGTTLAVAKKLSRRFLGFEISAQYAKEARARLKAIHPGDPLVGSEDALTSAPDTANGVVRSADGKRIRKNGTPMLDFSP